MQSYPVSFTAEYRGQEAAKSFKDRETGELVELGEVIKLERETVDGDAIPTAIRLDGERIDFDFDPKALTKGEQIEVQGEVVLYPSRPGYFKAFRLRRVKQAVRAA